MEKLAGNAAAPAAAIDPMGPFCCCCCGGALGKVANPAIEEPSCGGIPICSSVMLSFLTASFQTPILRRIS